MYRYYCTKHPPTICMLPLNGALLQDMERYLEQRYIPEIDRMAWGWVEYDHELTPEEVAKHGLVMEPRD